MLIELTEHLGPRARVIGVDISAGMSQRASRRVAHAGHTGQVAVLQADAASLPLMDGCVDGLQGFTLELFDDDEIGDVLAEVGRVLTPHGRLWFRRLATCRPPDPFAACRRSLYESGLGLSRVVSAQTDAGGVHRSHHRRPSRRGGT